MRTFLILCACILCVGMKSMAQADTLQDKQDSTAIEGKSKKKKSGKNKPYKVVSKSGNINNVQVTKKGGASGEVKVIVVRMNHKVNVTNLEIKTDRGNFFSENFTITNFPLQATITFQAPSATGFGSSMEQFSCKVSLNENGIWEIRINLANV